MSRAGPWEQAKRCKELCWQSSWEPHRRWRRAAGFPVQKVRQALRARQGCGVIEVRSGRRATRVSLVYQAVQSGPCKQMAQSGATRAEPWSRFSVQEAARQTERSGGQPPRLAFVSRNDCSHIARSLEGDALSCEGVRDNHLAFNVLYRGRRLHDHRSRFSNLHGMDQPKQEQGGQGQL